MAVTLQQIAQKAGVSRGTVDRALNNRGRIRPEVAERIKQIAGEMGYQPNRAGRAMSMAKRGLKIGVIVQSVETPFIQELMGGIEAAKAEVESLGGTVTIRPVKGLDAAQVIHIMEELKEEQYQAIALMPSDDQLLRQKIDLYVNEYQIPIVTFNVDLEDTGRISFVGQNAWESGLAAGGLLGEIVAEAGEVCVISGYEHHQALNSRVGGFVKTITESFPGLEIIGPRYTYDDNWVAEKVMEELLQLHPGIRGVYIAGYGEKGVCECLKKKGLEHTVKVVATDLVQENMNYLKDGSINFMIGQDPYRQGYEPTMILYRLLFDGIAPAREMFYTDIVIRTKYNIGQDVTPSL